MSYHTKSRSSQEYVIPYKHVSRDGQHMSLSHGAAAAGPAAAGPAARNRGTAPIGCASGPPPAAAPPCPRQVPTRLMPPFFSCCDRIVSFSAVAIEYAVFCFLSVSAIEPSLLRQMFALPFSSSRARLRPPTLPAYL